MCGQEKDERNQIADQEGNAVEKFSMIVKAGQRGGPKYNIYPILYVTLFYFVSSFPPRSCYFSLSNSPVR